MSDNKGCLLLATSQANKQTDRQTNIQIVKHTDTKGKGKGRQFV